MIIDLVIVGVVGGGIYIYGGVGVVVVAAAVIDIDGC